MDQTLLFRFRAVRVFQWWVSDRSIRSTTKLSRRRSKSNPWFTSSPTVRSFVSHTENFWKRTRSGLTWSNYATLRNRYCRLILMMMKFPISVCAEKTRKLVYSTAPKTRSSATVESDIARCRCTSPQPKSIISSPMYNIRPLNSHTHYVFIISRV